MFSGAIARAVEPAEPDADPPLARVHGADGRPLGLGLWNPRSQIRVRLLEGLDPAIGSSDATGSADPLGEALDRLLAERLEDALALRRAVLSSASSPGPGGPTTGYRLVNAEGDGLPAWTVDRFGEVLVSQITAAGLEALAPRAYGALARAVWGEEPPEGAAILEVRDLPARRAEKLPTGDDQAILGSPPTEATFTEHGLAFTAELTGGQKTGWYCDQRENRRRVEALAGGRTVLDLFAHTGAFGVYALRGGARSVTHVESSPRLVERGEDHYRTNGLPTDAVTWRKANVFEDLRESTERHDLVVCDPPPLVRRRGDLDKGARAYKDLNRLALTRTAPGGLFLTFSCSGAVDTKLFRQILFSAAVEAGARLALLEPLAAAPDHPIAITHPQGEYLKGWLCRVGG